MPLSMIGRKHFYDTSLPCNLKSRTPHVPVYTLTRRLAVVHLWPAVPTAAKRADGTTKLRSASSKAERSRNIHLSVL